MGARSTKNSVKKTVNNHGKSLTLTHKMTERAMQSTSLSRPPLPRNYRPEGALQPPARGNALGFDNNQQHKP